MEIRELINYPGYYIGENGTVYHENCYGELTVRQWDTSTGYPRVKIKAAGSVSRKNVYVSHLVASEFLPPHPKWKHYIWYIDGNPMNCYSNNLTWMSPSEIQRYSKYVRH